MAVFTGRRQDQQHEYALCDNPDCPRFPCHVYREGHEAGYAAGYAAGYGAGYSAGYVAGYGEGYAAGAAATAPSP